MSLILKLDDLIEGEVIKRPSKYIKTPYVADIKIHYTLYYINLFNIVLKILITILKSLEIKFCIGILLSFALFFSLCLFHNSNRCC